MSTQEILIYVLMAIDAAAFIFLCIEYKKHSR